MAHVLNDGPGGYVAPRGTTLIRWGAVIAGAVWAIAVFALLTTLWAAIGFQAGVDAIADNMNWWVAGTAIAALFIGGLVAGAMAGVRGSGIGAANGMTVWGVFVLIAAISGGVGAAGFLNLTNTGDVEATTAAENIFGGVGNDALWPAFFALLIGAAAAALGGLIGGASRARAMGVDMDDHDVYPTRERTVVRDDRDADVRDRRPAYVGRHDESREAREAGAYRSGEPSYESGTAEDYRPGGDYRDDDYRTTGQRDDYGTTGTTGTTGTGYRDANDVRRDDPRAYGYDDRTREFRNDRPDMR